MRLIVGLVLLSAPVLGAQSVRFSALPARAEPGGLVRLIVKSAPAHDSIVALRGSMAGEPLHFDRARAGSWNALGAVPVDASGEARAIAIVERASGARETLTVRLAVPRVRVATSRLKVDSSFSKPMDDATAARVERENERAREVGRHAHETPRLWTQPFLRPRASEITSRFGTGRLFNGEVTSRHLGVDFEGAIGDTVRAANRGVVVLVDEFFLAGNAVYVDHGAGVVTGYFHLSKTLVAPGDTVRRGQRIGLVGRTGRVTGPHLHWAARYGAVTFNPMDLLTVP